MTTETTKPFSVSLFASHPDCDNDDCWTGDSFATEAEARACFDAPWAPGCFDEAYYSDSTAFIMIDGPGINEVRANPGYRPRRRNDREWQREIAMQAGMMGGCIAYNEAMGYE